MWQEFRPAALFSKTLCPLNKIDSSLAKATEKTFYTIIFLPASWLLQSTVIYYCIHHHLPNNKF